MANFGDLKSDAGLAALNTHLEDKSYIVGYTPSQSDVSVFVSMGKAPAAKHAHALRWYTHIASYDSNEQKAFPVASQQAVACSKAAPATKTEDDDDEVDLFGSDDEEEDAEAARVREERLKAYADKKTNKPGPIAKSQILLDVKPWDDETDMKAMEEQVRSISVDGLHWGASKLNPLAYGIMKLSILATVVDDKVGVDDLIEKIQEFEDFVQSVDVAAFNKV